MNKQIIYTFFLFSVFLSQSAISMETDPMELDKNHNSKGEESIKIIAYKPNEQGELIKGRVTISHYSTITLLAKTCSPISGLHNGYKVKIQTPFFNNINTGMQVKCWTCYVENKYPLNVDQLFERKEYLKLRTKARGYLRSTVPTPDESLWV